MPMLALFFITLQLISRECMIVATRLVDPDLGFKR